MLVTFLVLLTGATHASTLLTPRRSGVNNDAPRIIKRGAIRDTLRFRGGADDDDDDESEMGPLTEDKVLEKLNTIPTFCVMGGENGFVALTLKEGGRAICFFTDPEEAKTVLNLTQSAHSDKSLHLAVISMGNAMKLCKGFDGILPEDEDDPALAAFAEFDGQLRLQGEHALVDELAPKLKTMLQTKSINEGAWQLPCFLCEELSTPDILPIFLSPRGIRDTWTAAGRKVEDLPEKFVLMDVRVLVSDMLNKGGMPWSKVQFVGSKESADFANELQEAARAKAAM